MMKNNLITLTKTMFKNDETLNNLTSNGSKSSFLKSKWMMILFVLGIAGILQAVIGHRLPIQEGPAGVWWGVFTLYASLGIEMFGSANNTLRVLSFCFLVSGVLFIILALLGLIDKIAKL